MWVFVERRATKRFRITLPMTVRWTTESAIGEGRTESDNISSRGVYFFLPKEVKNGSAVEMVLTLPHEITWAGPIRVRCQGRVRRTEIKKLDRVGVVAQIECYEFLRGNENAA
jgi:PilZ domain-containing protein